MNYRTNEDRRLCLEPCRPLYNNVLGTAFSSESTTEPVILDEVKTHLKIGYDDEDDYITDLIIQVRQIFEEVLWLSLIPRGVEAVLQFQVGERMELPFGPVLDVTNASDIDGNTVDHNDDLIVEIPGGFWSLITKYDYIKLVYTAGYSDTTIPRGLKNALIREIAWRYRHRGDEEGDSNGIHVRGALIYKRGSWLL